MQKGAHNMDLKFDHIIHYIDQLEQFKFPGEVVKLNSGGCLLYTSPSPRD